MFSYFNDLGFNICIDFKLLYLFILLYLYYIIIMVMRISIDIHFVSLLGL